MSYYGYGGFPEYIPVAQRKQKMAKKLAALQKKGVKLEPVQPNGQKIARTFWGQSWCRNLESYSDYENRLPRGRSYLRQGAVLDLKITKGTVAALVQGSSLYKINISITPIAEKEWKSLIQECSGKIDSLIELLQGQFSKTIMEAMTRPQTGLFPRPKQIKLSCSCPDWAEMCKHVAAVLYGVGARLDERPELLFALRKVDHEDLVSHIDVIKVTQRQAASDEQILGDENLENIFGIDLGLAQKDDLKSKPTPLKKTRSKQKTIHKSKKKRPPSKTFSKASRGRL